MLAQVDGTPMSVRVAAECQDVPYSFARGIQHGLVLSGLVTARRGAHGGILLARPADEITLWDVIEAVQGTLSISVCSVDPDWCKRSSSCPFHTVWVDVDQAVHDRLVSVTIADMVARQRLSSLKATSDIASLTTRTQEQRHETWSRRAVRAAQRREERNSAPTGSGKGAKGPLATPEVPEGETARDGS